MGAGQEGALWGGVHPVRHPHESLVVMGQVLLRTHRTIFGPLA